MSRDKSKRRQSKVRQSKVRLRSSSSPPGTTPGTLTAVEGALEPEISFVYYTESQVEEGLTQDLNVIEELRSRDGVLWVDVCGLGNIKTLEALGKAFSIHPLALEDVINPQRSKVEDYPGLLFIVARRALLGELGTTEQISLFMGPKLVVTFREKRSNWLDSIKGRIRQGHSRLRSRGSDYLAYALLDSVVDHCFPAVESYGDQLDLLESELLIGPTQNFGRDLQLARQGLLHLRRAIWPLQEALAYLMRDDIDLINKETSIFLRDCKDHVVRAIDLIDSYRELAADLMDLHLANLSTRMNEIMKTLTIIATLFIPLSFIAGLYGMNFDASKSPFNMPELSWYWGYPFALSVMAMTAIMLLLFFRKKGWLG